MAKAPIKPLRPADERHVPIVERQDRHRWHRGPRRGGDRFKHRAKAGATKWKNYR